MTNQSSMCSILSFSAVSLTKAMTDIFCWEPSADSATQKRGGRFWRRHECQLCSGYTACKACITELAYLQKELWKTRNKAKKSKKIEPSNN